MTQFITNYAKQDPSFIRMKTLQHKASIPDQHLYKTELLLLEVCDMHWNNLQTPISGINKYVYKTKHITIIHTLGKVSPKSVNKKKKY